MGSFVRKVAGPASVVGLAVAIRFVAVIDLRLTTVLVCALSVLALAVGWWFNGRGRAGPVRTAWRLLTFYAVLTAAATVESVVHPAAFGFTQLIRISAAAVGVAALLALIRHRLEDKPVEALGEAGMTCAGIGYLVFATVIAPGSRGGWGTGHQFLALVVPLLDFVVAWLGVRTAWLTERHPITYRYLLAGFASLLVGDALVAGSVLGHGSATGGNVTAFNLWAICMIGAAALHPSRRSAFEPVPLRPHRVTWVQTAAICVALAAVPVALLVNALGHRPIRASVVVVGTALLPLLVTLHLARQVVDRAAAAYRAQHDPLTGVLNRVLFEDRLDAALEHARRTAGRVGVMFLDLDHFKTVNDSLGHTVGNQLLVQVAARLQASVRDKDTVARLGGDEFTVILPTVADRQDCVAAAERVMSEFMRPFSVGGRSLNVKSSLGIAVFPEDGDSAESLIKNADTAMYRAKAGGRGTYVAYDAAMSSRAQLRFALEASLQSAISQGQLAVHYQPKINATSGDVVGVEALARWKHPRLGYISPWAFISLAEETGHIAAIGEWVLEEACSQARRWQSQGVRMPVAVNLSSCQFEQTPIVEVVRGVLDRTGLDPSLLELEVTENLLVKDIESATGSLRRLSTLGVRWSIDDFGTGYSALSYLAEMPVSALKIDRSFIKRIGSEKRQTAIVSAVIALADSLGMDVVAEGVETREQLAILQQRGCEQVQGYLFSPAVPGELIEGFLDSWYGSSAGPVTRAALPGPAIRPLVTPAALNRLVESVVADRTDDSALDLATAQVVLAALLADQASPVSLNRQLHRLPARIAAGTFAGLVPLSGGLAAAGALPAPVQLIAAQAFRSAGVILPTAGAGISSSHSSLHLPGHAHGKQAGETPPAGPRAPGKPPTTPGHETHQPPDHQPGHTSTGPKQAGGGQSTPPGKGPKAPHGHGNGDKPPSGKGNKPPAPPRTGNPHTGTPKSSSPPHKGKPAATPGHGKTSKQQTSGPDPSHHSSSKPPAPPS